LVNKSEKTMFTHAIVKKPAHSLIHGITSASLGKPVYEKALEQHAMYVDALTRCGVKVIKLNADERFPDSTFVEDTAVLTETCAIVSNPGAKSRKGEERTIKEVLSRFYTNIKCIEAPGTLEGGDVMRVKDHFYIGLSERTNAIGAQQCLQLLGSYGYSGSTIALKDMLHLKTGLAYLGRDTLLVAGEFIENPEFRQFDRIIIDALEHYAANCIRVNDYVLVPAGYPKTLIAIEQAGYQTITVDVSEFRKLDGGLSCLSLRVQEIP
jgi:dimethylargininase